MAALKVKMPTQSQIDPLIVLSERYDVLERIGSGTVCTVHRALHVESGKEVALKVPRMIDSSSASAATKQEYELLKDLQPHPNIIRVVGFHNLREEATLVLEFFDGSSLQAAVQEKRLLEHTAKALSVCLFRAVAHLHARGILHRDLKPENVLVSPCRADLRIIDFNAAVSLDNAVPLTPVGTELYKAPELLLGGPACEKSDVWASGLCVFYMLSGRLPQERDSKNALGRSKAEVALRPTTFCHEHWGHISEECKSMLHSCLAIRSEERPMMVDLLEDDWFLKPISLILSLSILSRALPGAEAYVNVLSYLSNTQSA